MLRCFRRFLAIFPLGGAALAACLGMALIAQPSGVHADTPRLSYNSSLNKADLVLIRKGERRLELWHGQELLRHYRVALGRNPDGPKQRQGDGRTPEGQYIIDWRNPDSDFHLSLHISYPAVSDIARAREAGHSPGELIMIHGLPNGFSARYVEHPQRDWTEGCIAVTNAEIEEIWRMVDDGTTIVILP